MAEWHQIARYFECDCGTHAVHLSASQLGTTQGFDCIGLSFWKHGKDYGSSIKWRLSYIRDIIRYGHPHLDEVLLDKDTAREMGEMLIELSEQMKDYK